MTSPSAVLLPEPVEQLMTASASCASHVGTSVRCWGPNIFGELGTAAMGPVPQSLTPVLPSSVVALAGGGAHTCAIVDGGDVWCWGSNGANQLGVDGGNAATAQHTVVSGVIAVTAGEEHTCAIISDGGVRCWGQNASGQLGGGFLTFVAAGPPTPQPVEVIVLGGVAATQVSAGDSHTCARLADGTARCWGYPGAGALGLPMSAGGQVAGLSGILAIAAGGSFTCALLDTREVRCWGANEFGQLGADGGAGPAFPKVDPGVRGAVQLAAGRQFACALLVDGGVSCWGRNDKGVLGIGSTASPVGPQRVSGL